MSCIRHFIYIHCGTDFKMFCEDKACFLSVLCCVILHFDLLSFYQDNSMNSGLGSIHVTGKCVRNFDVEKCYSEVQLENIPE